MIYYGQFNHVDNDRQYLDSDIAAMLSLLTGGPGVINHPAGGLLVANVTGLQISVAAGGAWLGSPAGWYYYSDDEQLLTLDSETSGYNRIDRVVLRLNRNTEVRTVALDVIKGTAVTSAPSAPALTQNDTLYEMSLAQIAITGGSTSIAITDERDLIATASSALIAEDIINTLTSTDTDKPLSAAQGKALNDLKIAIADIINTLTSTDTDKPLSAAQGKALNDAKVAISDIQNTLASTATNKPLSAYQGKVLNEAKTALAAWDNTTFNIDTAASYNFMLKRGSGAATSTGNGNAFGTAFPNACLAVVAVANGTNVGPAITTTVIDRGGFNAYASSTYGITYIAIGY